MCTFINDFHELVCCSDSDVEEALFLRVFWQNRHTCHVTNPIRRLLDSTLRLLTESASEKKTAEVRGREGGREGN